MEPYLEERRNRILEAIIQAYAELAAPVGSAFLTSRYQFGVSSATIRNVMAELERLGLITHPHTSAGRVPTDLGYRYYVDLLMEPKSPRIEAELLMSGLRSGQPGASQALLERAAAILSEVTQAAAVVLVPEWTQGTFRRFEFLPIGSRELLAVLVTSEGMIRHALFEMEEPVDPELLRVVSELLNNELEGVQLSRVEAALAQLVERLEGRLAAAGRELLSALSFQSLLLDEASLILQGTDWVLSAPEFKDLERIQRLITALQNKRELVELLRRDLAASRVKLHIGSENKGTMLTDCTLVSAPYRYRGGAMGAIGVLGPTRMDYPRVTGAVQRMAESLTRALDG